MLPSSGTRYTSNSTSFVRDRPLLTSSYSSASSAGSSFQRNLELSRIRSSRTNTYCQPTYAISPPITNTYSSYKPTLYSHRASSGSSSSYSTLPSSSSFSSRYTSFNQYDSAASVDYKSSTEKRRLDSSLKDSTFTSPVKTEVTINCNREQLYGSPFEYKSTLTWSGNTRSTFSTNSSINGSAQSTTTSGFVSACSTEATSANSSRRGSVTLSTSNQINGSKLQSAADNNKLVEDELPNAGFNNLGNTCYMNAILQCLIRTKPLCQLVKAIEHADENTNLESATNASSAESKRRLTISILKLIQRVSRSRSNTYLALSNRSSGSSSISSISPLEFKKEFETVAPRFRGYGQQDAHEFLCYVLDALSDEIAPNSSLAPTALNNNNQVVKETTADFKHTFVGELQSALRCQTCQNESVTVDSFMHLSVSITDENSNSFGLSSAYSSSYHKDIGYGDVVGDHTEMPTIEKCIEMFMKEETLDGPEAPLCERCKEKRQSTKGFSIRKFPKILIVHIKRFAGERYKSKNSTVVNFPMDNLRLGKFAIAGEKVPAYDLYAVVNHSGSQEYGHYTAYVRQRGLNTSLSLDSASSTSSSSSNYASSEWICFDDSRVSEIAAKRVVSSEAYLLFYEMRGNCAGNGNDTDNEN